MPFLNTDHKSRSRATGHVSPSPLFNDENPQDFSDSEDQGTQDSLIRPAVELSEAGLYRLSQPALPPSRVLVPLSGMILALIMLSATEHFSDKWLATRYDLSLIHI